MEPIFTIHAGEYLVGMMLQKELKNCDVWIPAKDRGIDLLVTNKGDFKKNVSIQVKYSKDFAVENRTKNLFEGLFNLNKKKLSSQPADLWILYISNVKKDFTYLVIDPKELARRVNSYSKTNAGGSFILCLHVFKDKEGKTRCVDVKNLPKKEIKVIEDGGGKLANRNRDFSSYIKALDGLKKRVK